MSNFSEDEILDDINFCLEGEYITREHYEAIQGLLDLYKQTKKKLTEYENQMDLDYVDENYVSKDKIREKIEELEELRDENADEIKRNIRFYSIYDSYNLQISELQELLEEE